MDHSFSGGSWTMIPNMQSHSNVSTPTSQDQQFYLNQQQQQHFQQQYQQQHRIVQQQQQFQQQPQSLASHFHLLPLVENLAGAVENGNRDQQTEALINELSSHFEKCQQLLNSIAGTIGDKNVTVEGQKRKLEETEKMLNQRREWIAAYRNSVEEILKSEP